jgi:Smg-4/UPF3 family
VFQSNPPFCIRHGVRVDIAAVLYSYCTLLQFFKGSPVLFGTLGIMEDRRRGDGGSVSGSGTTVNKKKRRNKRRRDPRKGPPSARGPPPTPALKVTIRNIFSPNVAEIVRTLVSRANEKLTALDPKMGLDDVHLEQLVADENSALEAAKKWRAEKENASSDNERANGENDGAMTMETDSVKEAATVDGLIADVDKNLHISIANGVNSGNANSASVGGICQKGNQIMTRVLYFVAPKKTHRRGEKPGVAYLVLSAPPMETLDPVVEPATQEPLLNGNYETATSHSSVIPLATVPPSTVDYTRDVAKRRLMLQKAFDAMQAVVAADSSHNADAMVVEESVNSKTWKQQSPHRSLPVDRMVGTIFDTDDYKQFLERTAKEEEQRLARPKPVPGGGIAHGGTITDATAQPVAALVLHLQQKQEEEKKRKLAKRKTKETKAKKLVTSNSTEKVPAVGKGGRAEQKSADQKRIRRTKRKKPISNGTKSAAAAPNKPNGS